MTRLKCENGGESEVVRVREKDGEVNFTASVAVAV